VNNEIYKVLRKELITNVPNKPLFCSTTRLHRVIILNEQHAKLTNRNFVNFFNNILLQIFKIGWPVTMKHPCLKLPQKV